MSSARFLGLRSHILLLLGLLMAVAVGGAAASLWQAQRSMQPVSQALMADAALLAAADGMQLALVRQQDAITGLLRFGAPKWRKQLDVARQDFSREWRAALDLAKEEVQRQRIFALDNAYVSYQAHQDRALKAQAREEPLDEASLQRRFMEAMLASAQVTYVQKAALRASLQTMQQRVRELQRGAWLAIPLLLAMGGWLGWLLMRRVMLPILRLRRELQGYLESLQVRQHDQQVFGPEDEVASLGKTIHHLLQDVGSVRHKLARSREELAQSEKMALIGKLAAGVAHSVRNPLTSVKMRLYTLERAVTLPPGPREDLDVINEELAFIDNILKNFLEFSRPPKLRPRPVSPSTVVDQACQLLKYRFENVGVDVHVERSHPLPPIMGDPEQLKEVLVNLLVNAMDAMAPMASTQPRSQRASIRITEDVGVLEPYGDVAILRITDSGPGIAPGVHAKLFEPFITTKEDGTGLGLAIARHTIEKHGGWIHATSEPNHGATFVIGLPLLEQSA